MTGFLEGLAEFAFLRHALAAGLLASALCGIVGTFVVVRRLVFVGGGVSHAAFAGVGLGSALGWDPKLGAGATALVSAWYLSGRAGGREADIRIGILWSVGMALGLVFLRFTPGYVPDPTPLLFGNVLGTTAADVAWLAALVVAGSTLLALFWKEAVAAAFDEDFAAIQGVRVRAAHRLWMTFIALSVTLTIQLVGILLVLALLAIPAAIAIRFCGGFGATMAAACAIGAAMTVGGLALSWSTDLPSGPTIVLLGAAGLALVQLGDVARRAARRSLRRAA